MSWTEAVVDYQRHVSRVATVDTVEQAFAFVLTAIEAEHLDTPTIHVLPVMSYDPGTDESVVRFEVSVVGSVEMYAKRGPG